MGQDHDHPRAELSEETAALIELVFARLDAERGNWRLEFFATDGRVRTYRRQEEGGRDLLARFDADHAATGPAGDGEAS